MLRKGRLINARKGGDIYVATMGKRHIRLVGYACFLFVYGFRNQPRGNAFNRPGSRGFGLLGGGQRGQREWWEALNAKLSSLTMKYLSIK